MAKIAVILDNMFEDVEYTRPVEEFKKSGHEVISIGLSRGIVKGKKEGTEVDIDKEIREVSHKDFDALLIPGGYSPDRLRAHEEPVKFVKNFVESGKPVFSICHGPQLLISAGVLRGKKITGYKSIVEDIKNAGATYTDYKVVVDGNLVSSRNPDDLDFFIDESLKKIKGG